MARSKKKNPQANNQILRSLIGQVIDEKKLATKKDVSRLTKDVTGLKKDVSGLKKDVSRLTKDVTGLKKDVSGLKGDVSRLTKDVTGLKKDVSGLATKTDIAEVMWELKGIREENIILADMKRQVNIHEDRIETIEEKLKIQPLAA